MRKVDPRTIPYAALRKAKIINEFKMAKDLRTLFEQREQLYKPANRVARLALEILSAINRYAAERGGERLQQGDAMCTKVMWTYGKEAALTILAKHSPELLEIKKEIDQLERDVRAAPATTQNFERRQKAVALNVYEYANRAINNLQAQAQRTVAGGGAFNAGQIGEILRLFAGVCENVNPDPTDGGKGNLAKNITLELFGVAPTQDKVAFNFGDYCGLRAAYRNTAWGSKAFSKMARDRSPRSPAEINRFGTDRASVEAAVLNTLDIKPLTPSGPFAPTGNMLFVLGAQDVVGKINRTLGLLDGADISGTTSDTIWALETLMTWVKRFDSSFVINPNLLLLPVAAIVGGFHHTVLEVGLALSINYDTGPQRIAYAPGFFTSLQNETMRTAEGGQEIAALLREAELNIDNVLLLAADDGATQRLVYFADDEKDRLAFRRVLEMTAANYSVWQSLVLAPLNIGALKWLCEKLES